MNLKVVRWSTKIIPANELKPQFFNWGGFDATALSFTPFIEENDETFNFWRGELQEYHNQKLYPNKYILDLSNFKYKTEKELIDLGHKSHVDDTELKNLGIYITLAHFKTLKIVEFRIYDYCKDIIILDN